ncbi:MAG TPA: hypothetical protein VN625_11235, partial [Desulfuromonadaceae bacterium]|nr:hypothetical protein [Desulfuromonadaceae bacterium]
KYERMLHFAAALPAIRKSVCNDLRQHGLGRAKVIAAIVKLMDLSAARVGNEQYAKENGSFGLTTLRNRHVHVNGSRIELDFKGKASKHQHLIVDHPVLSRIVRKCQHLPGQKLFEYVDHEKNIHRVKSDDVNCYLADIVGDEFTSKDFRTWKATVLALQQLQDFPPCEATRTRKSNLVRAVECVASNLGNTPAICKKCYIHPALLDHYLGGTLFAKSGGRVQHSRSEAKLSAVERALVRFLKRHKNGSQKHP